MFPNQEMDISRKQNDVLKVVLPGPHVMIYRQPITAGEIMRKYPRHCITRPDVFENPWIVVRPESILVPGEVFYLVPYHTLDNLMKAKMKQQQPLLCSNSDQSSPTKAQAGVTPKHKQPNGGTGRQLQEHDCHETQEQDSDSPRRFYRPEFCRLWNDMQQSLHQSRESGDQFSSLVDSPFLDRMTGFQSPEDAESPRPKSCLRKADSIRKKLNLKVSFGSPLVIPGSRRGSPT